MISRPAEPRATDGHRPLGASSRRTPSTAGSNGPDALDTLVETVRRAAHVPGLAVAVVDADGVRWAHGWGRADLSRDLPYTPDSVGHWFSMTKVATVTAAMRLVDQGRLDLDAPVRDHLPDLWPAAFDAVRVVHLAEHSAGLANPLPLRWVHPAGDPVPDQRALLARHLRRQRRPKFEPGSRASYSNLSTIALGEVIATITGRSLTEEIRQELLVPLGMTATSFERRPQDAERAAVGYQRLPRLLEPALRRYLPDGLVGERVGRDVAFQPFEMDTPACSGLIGPVDDAARFLRLHVRDGELDGVRILSPGSARAMRTIRRPGRPYDLGLGWFRPRRDRARSSGPTAYVEHFGGGGGFWNVLRLYPERGLGVVVMGNTTRRYDVSRIADAAVTTPGTGGPDQSS